MFMCCTKKFSAINLDLFWNEIFSYTLIVSSCYHICISLTLFLFSFGAPSIQSPFLLYSQPLFLSCYRDDSDDDGEDEIVGDVFLADGRRAEQVGDDDGLGVNVIQLFSSLTRRQNMLECLSLISFVRLGLILASKARV